MVALIIFPVILQTVVNVSMLSIGGQGAYWTWLRETSLSVINASPLHCTMHPTNVLAGWCWSYSIPEVSAEFNDA